MSILQQDSTSYDCGLQARRVTDPASFTARAREHLLADEARHNLILGIAGTLSRHPKVFQEYALWLVEDEGRVVLAALQTPPYNLTLSRPLDVAAVPVLADALEDEGRSLPGVTAAVPEVEGFVEEWTRRHNVAARPRMAQRIYRVSRVRPVTGVPGQPRAATKSDRSLLVEWVTEFAKESLPEDAPGRATQRTVAARLDHGAGGFVLWEDDGPVSLAGWGGETPHGVRIGPVYTPPQRRGRGYASALVAALSERLLNQRRCCFLYTDLANPTSNRIYVDVGYELVCESAQYAFSGGRSR
jgi:predicted GNAT family acetyltransferase